MKKPSQELFGGKKMVSIEKVVITITLVGFFIWAFIYVPINAMIPKPQQPSVGGMALVEFTGVIYAVWSIIAFLIWALRTKVEVKK